MELLLAIFLGIKIGLSWPYLEEQGSHLLLNTASRFHIKGEHKIAMCILDGLQLIDDSNYSVYETRAALIGDMGMGKDEEPIYIRNLNAAIRLAPKQAGLSYYLRGLLAFDNGDWQQVVKDMSRSLELVSSGPSVCDAYVLRAAANIYLSNNIAAINDAVHATSLCPSEIAPLTTLAFAYNAIGNHDEAMNNLKYASQLALSNKVVIAHKSELVNMLLESALNMYMERRYEDALLVLEYIRLLDDSYYRLYETKAMVLLNMKGKGKDAEPMIVSNLNMAISLAPEQSAYSYYLRADIAFRNKEWTNSLSDLARIIEIHPTDQGVYESYIMRCRIYAILSNHVATIEEANRANKICPQEPLPYVILADSYNAISNRSEAIRNLNIAVQYAPTNEMVIEQKKIIMGE